jgi:oxygen-independent coproporphyrinogen-3 oxidase
MGLRLSEGIDLTRLQGVAGQALEELFDLAALERLVAEGLLEQRAGHLAATAAGRQRLNALLAAIVR